MSRSEINRIKKDDCIKRTAKNISKCIESIDQMKAMKENNCELERNISQNLMQIKYDIKRYISELQPKCRDIINFLKEQNSNLDTQMDEMGKKQKQLEKENGLLQRTNLKKKPVDEADGTNRSAECLLSTIKCDVSRNQQIHQGVKKRTETIEEKLKLIKDLTSPLEDEHEFLKIMGVATCKVEHTAKITPQILQNMSATTRYLVHLEGLYAVKQQERVTRYGKLSLSANKLCLHHLGETQPPTNVTTVDFDAVMKLVDQSSMQTFLEFGNDERRFCKVFIQLHNNTKRAQNFALLCSGQMGVSYANTNIFGADENEYEKFIKSGDNENTGDGGKALVPGSGEEKGGSLVKTSEKGSVVGWYHNGDAQASQFYIITLVKKPYTQNTQFGKVVSGINELVEVTSNYPNKNQLKITDCGMVLTTNFCKK